MWAERIAPVTPRITRNKSLSGAAIVPRTSQLAEDLAATSMALARRLAAGATMWCTSPEWPFHAEHVAVEFVHPVIVGKRALPAAAVPGDRLTGDLRALARSGDIFVAIAPARCAATAAAMRRARAWGLETVWIGAGPRPPPGAADFVLFVDGDEVTAAYGGGLVLAYHVLWELTHVCLEHPGLLRPGPVEDTGDACATCSDEGRLGEVISVHDTAAEVRTPAGVESVDLSLVDARPGDLVLIHAGSAVTVIEEPTS
jgi:hypothetical protein